MAGYLQATDALLELKAQGNLLGYVVATFHGAARGETVDNSDYELFGQYATLEEAFCCLPVVPVSSLLAFPFSPLFSPLLLSLLPAASNFV